MKFFVVVLVGLFAWAIYSSIEPAGVFNIHISLAHRCFVGALRLMSLGAHYTRLHVVNTTTGVGSLELKVMRWLWRVKGIPKGCAKTGKFSVEDLVAKRSAGSGWRFVLGAAPTHVLRREEDGHLWVYGNCTTNTSRVVLYMHGGGAWGHPDQDIGALFALSRELNAPLLSVRYALAPEYRAPGPGLDVAGMLVRLAATGRRLVVVAQVSGASLAFNMSNK
jgi:acetyl esterase/lipase